MRFWTSHSRNVDSSTKFVRLTETSIPVLNLYYDLTKIQLAHGNVDSSTKFVLRVDENSAGLTETSIPVRVVDREQNSEDAPHASAVSASPRL